MAYSFIKEQKQYYNPSATPALIDIPEMTFIMVKGKGNPNDTKGEYPQALSLLYGLSYTIKMSKMMAKKDGGKSIRDGGGVIDGYFDYMVPPLEGLWWTEGEKPAEGSFNKNALCWISMIRQPEFVTAEVFDWATRQVHDKKPELRPFIDRAQLVTFCEGLCVQCMHTGIYDDEPATFARMNNTIAGKAERIFREIDAMHTGVQPMHHEIYLGDPRRIAPEKRKTILRYPVALKTTA